MNGFILHRLARADLQEAIGFYRRESPELGRDFYSEVERVIERLVAHPESAPRAGRNLRKARIFRFPYNLLYRVDDDHIFVIAVFHQRRRPAMASIGDDMPNHDGDETHHPNYERLWNEEIERRCRAIDEGRAQLIPADEVFVRAEAALG